MKARYIIFITMFMIFFNSINAFSDDKITTYYYTNNSYGYENIVSKDYRFFGEFSTEEKVRLLLGNLFNGFYKDINFIPKNVSINNLMFRDGHIVIDFDENILKYGGTYYEDRLISQILWSVLVFDEVKFVTLNIEGKTGIFTEGTVILKYSK